MSTVTNYLYIRNLTVNDTGYYSCSMVGSVNETRIIKLWVMRRMCPVRYECENELFAILLTLVIIIIVFAIIIMLEITRRRGEIAKMKIL